MLGDPMVSVTFVVERPGNQDQIAHAEPLCDWKAFMKSAYPIINFIWMHHTPAAAVDDVADHRADLDVWIIRQGIDIAVVPSPELDEQTGGGDTLSPLKEGKIAKLRYPHIPTACSS